MYFDFSVNQFRQTDVGADKLAISGTDRDFSWSELSEETGHYISLFRELDIPKGHPVIIYGHQESRFLVIMLALVSLDIPYIPLDKIYPEDRVATIQKQSGSEVVIKSGDYPVPEGFSLVVHADRSWTKHNDPKFNVILGNDTDPLRYVMFTSGSTGVPKGVQITRSAYLSFIDWLKEDHPFSGKDVFLNQAPFSFDLSVYNILGALSIGAGLVLFDNETCSDHDRFFQRLHGYKVTTWISTPSFVYIYLRSPEFSPVHLHQLRTFIFIGETLPLKTVRDLQAKFPENTIINSYGPTEATVATCFVTITKDILLEYNDLPIGVEKMNGNVMTFKEDKPGTEGELVIVGDHVSTGYLNRPELNAEKFFTWEGKRAYRTGDQGHFKNNYLFFLGRNDKQIKLNGYRIELGEINSTIENSGLVEASVVIPLKRNDVVKKIIAVIVPKVDLQVPVADIKHEVMQKIRAALPPYMVPGDIRSVTAFPYNINHKIDIVRLTEMYISNQLD